MQQAHSYHSHCCCCSRCSWLRSHPTALLLAQHQKKNVPLLFFYYYYFFKWSPKDPGILLSSSSPSCNLGFHAPHQRSPKKEAVTRQLYKLQEHSHALQHLELLRFPLMQEKATSLTLNRAACCHSKLPPSRFLLGYCFNEVICELASRTIQPVRMRHFSSTFPSISFRGGGNEDNPKLARWIQ